MSVQPTSITVTTRTSVSGRAGASLARYGTADGRMQGRWWPTSATGLQQFQPCHPIMQFEFVLGNLVLQIYYAFRPRFCLRERAGVQGFQAATIRRNSGLQLYNPIGDVPVFVGSCGACPHRHFGRYPWGAHDGPFNSRGNLRNAGLRRIVPGGRSLCQGLGRCGVWASHNPGDRRHPPRSSRATVPGTRLASFRSVNAEVRTGGLDTGRSRPRSWRGGRTAGLREGCYCACACPLLSRWTTLAAGQCPSAACSPDAMTASRTSCRTSPPRTTSDDEAHGRRSAPALLPRRPTASVSRCCPKS